MKLFYRQTIGLLETIEDCLEKRRFLPTLVLLYAAIDIIAGFEAQPGEGTRASFVRWVDAHMLKDGRLGCTSLELYAARCGIVHSYSADSDLSRSRKVRVIQYAWGTADAGQLNEAAQIIGRAEHCVALHVRDLLEAFRRGLADYVEEVCGDPRREAIVRSRIDRWFVDLDLGLVAEVVRETKESGSV